MGQKKGKKGRLVAMRGKVRLFCTTQLDEAAALDAVRGLLQNTNPPPTDRKQAKQGSNHV